jgi:hypothetical protein
MLCLGALEGRGRLQIDNDLFGPVSYQLIVWQKRNGVQSARGNLAGKMKPLMRAFACGTARLLLKGGVTVPIVLVRFDGKARAEFLVAGPVPGF